MSFPGIHVFFEKSSENISPELLEFAVKSGRAVLYPIYMGTYERRITSSPVRQTPEEVVQPGSSTVSHSGSAGLGETPCDVRVRAPPAIPANR